MARLTRILRKTVVPKLTEQFGYKNVMQVPRITKITLNMGVGEADGRQEDHGERRRRHDHDRRPEAGRHQGARSPIATFKIREAIRSAAR